MDKNSVPHVFVDLLDFAFARVERIRSRAADADVAAVPAGEGVVAAAEDAVVSAASVNDVRAGTAEDQIVAVGAGQYSGTANDLSQRDPMTLERLDIIQCDRNSNHVHIRRRDGYACRKSRDDADDDQGKQSKDHKSKQK